MWFLGLVVGMLIGGLAFGFLGAAFGAVLGLLAGVWLDRRQRDQKTVPPTASLPHRSDAERIRLLETQVEWLHGETLALRREIAVLHGAAPAASEAAATPVVQPVVAEPDANPEAPRREVTGAAPDRKSVV